MAKYSSYTAQKPVIGKKMSINKVKQDKTT